MPVKYPECFGKWTDCENISCELRFLCYKYEEEIPSYRAIIRNTIKMPHKPRTGG